MFQREVRLFGSVTSGARGFGEGEGSLADAEVELLASVAGLGQFEASRGSDLLGAASIPGRWGLEVDRTVQSFSVVMIDEDAKRLL